MFVKEGKTPNTKVKWLIQKTPTFSEIKNTSGLIKKENSEYENSIDSVPFVYTVLGTDGLGQYL